MLQAAFPFLLSVEFLQEYRQVLLRPKIQRLHRLPEAKIDIILKELAANAIFRELIETDSQVPDENDQHLWKLLAAIPHAILITGDQLLLKKPARFRPRHHCTIFSCLVKTG